jgi:hypothetical protein
MTVPPGADPGRPEAGELVRAGSHSQLKVFPPMDGLAYKPALAQTLDRLRSLYSRLAGDRILARMLIPSPTLERFQAEHEEGYCDYPPPEERIAFWDSLLGESAAVEDDSVPAAYLSELDQGLYGGLVGGEVRFLCDPKMGRIFSIEWGSVAAGRAATRPSGCRGGSSRRAWTPST